MNRVFRAGFIAVAAGLAMLVSAPAALAATPHQAGGSIRPAHYLGDLIEAENYNGQHGTGIEYTNEYRCYVGYIGNGDWTQYSEVQFPNPGFTSYINLIIASPRAGSVQIKLDSLNNAPIATVAVVAHGGWTDWWSYDVVLPPVTGYHTVYLNYFTNGPDFMNIDWFQVHE